MNEKFTLTQAYQLPELFAMLTRAVAVGEHEISIKKRVKQRSIPQNNSLHLWASIISELMNMAGITQKALQLKFKEGWELPITEDFIKSIFRKIGLVMYGKASTADLTTVEMMEVYKLVDERLSQLTAIHVPWPSSKPPTYDGEKY